MTLFDKSRGYGGRERRACGLGEKRDLFVENESIRVAADGDDRATRLQIVEDLQRRVRYGKDPLLYR